MLITGGSSGLNGVVYCSDFVCQASRSRLPIQRMPPAHESWQYNNEHGEQDRKTWHDEQGLEQKNPRRN